MEEIAYNRILCESVDNEELLKRHGELYYMDELYNSYWQNNDLTGTINSYIMFSNSIGLEEKMNRVITESGYAAKEED